MRRSTSALWSSLRGALRGGWLDLGVDAEGGLQGRGAVDGVEGVLRQPLDGAAIGLEAVDDLLGERGLRGEERVAGLARAAGGADPLGGGVDPGEPRVARAEDLVGDAERVHPAHRLGERRQTMARTAGWAKVR